MNRFMKGIFRYCANKIDIRIFRKPIVFGAYGIKYLKKIQYHPSTINWFRQSLRITAQTHVTIITIITTFLKQLKTLNNTPQNHQIFQEPSKTLIYPQKYSKIFDCWWSREFLPLFFTMGEGFEGSWRIWGNNGYHSHVSLRYYS